MIYLDLLFMGLSSSYDLIHEFDKLTQVDLDHFFFQLYPSIFNQRLKKKKKALKRLGLAYSTAYFKDAQVN